MRFYEKGNLLIVYGGKRFANSDPAVKYGKSEFVSSVVVLRMDTLIWYDVKFRDSEGCLKKFPNVYNFSSEIADDKIFIFGGMLDTHSQSKNLYGMKLVHRRLAYDEEPNIFTS